MMPTCEERSNYVPQLGLKVVALTLYCRFLRKFKEENVTLSSLHLNDKVFKFYVLNYTIFHRCTLTFEVILSRDSSVHHSILCTVFFFRSNRIVPK